MKKPLLVLLAAALSLSSLAFYSGGWAVVSVSKIPDHWIAGKPLQLSWQVRQHGVSRLTGLQPNLEARSGARIIRGLTWEFNEDGQRGYRGRITFPEPGDWQVTIHSGFGRSKAVLVPWRVVDSVTRVEGTVEEHLAKRGIEPFTPYEQGRRMFAAKGCVTCHVHRAVDIEGDLKNTGPDLTDRRFAADYLAKFLADPSIKPPSGNSMSMPDPGLREKDITPLVAFINAERRLTSR